MSHKRNLIILNECYPFDKGEQFMENEIPLLNEFDEIYICPCSVKDLIKTRNINNSNAKIIAIKNDNFLYGKILKIYRYMKCFFNPLVWKEISFLANVKKLNRRTLKSLFSFASQAEHCIKKIQKQLKNGGKDDQIIFYSYWLSFHAYIAVKLKKIYPTSIAVSRCHRFDLYEYRNEDNYIPMRKYILENLDTVFSISEDGKKYLEDRYPNISKNITVSRLGTMDYGVRQTNITRKPLKIVSCSWVSPVKRVLKIVDALSKIRDIDIEWTHFGDGALFDKLKEYAGKKLCFNIKTNFPGASSNTDLMEKYKNNDFHIFVNVSESEGVPVSIMESTSFGIPVIATDVGGVNEIVIHGENGFLMGKDFADDDLIGYIRKFAEMDNHEYMDYRKNARELWEKNYNAEKNYLEFVHCLMNGM